MGRFLDSVLSLSLSLFIKKKNNEQTLRQQLKHLNFLERWRSRESEHTPCLSHEARWICVCIYISFSLYIYYIYVCVWMSTSNILILVSINFPLQHTLSVFLFLLIRLEEKGKKLTHIRVRWG